MTESNSNKIKYLIFPLGNPGEKYSKTRHNAGRILLSFLKKEESFKKILEENDIEIFIPDGYMNESGKYLKKYIKNKNYKTENIIVLYDDKDLEIGDIRLAKDRGDGGHNGLKNIIENLGTKDFSRIRIGIAPKGTGKNSLIPPHGDIVQKYVLAKMPKEEIEILASKKVLERAIFFLEEIIKDKK
ncbi:Peptidyl-tRNA hydrolase [bioreactor metagenome]|uniref:peptidyl-tRNA hydrolase n=1 Tax=bioreactor metagenome TaxID=1076179 RepID=A0A644T8V3_9ZZZZ|nr:aminoacyl-tRNA hydrolase [Candidatus Elulimicrobiales bacterium]